MFNGVYAHVFLDTCKCVCVCVWPCSLTCEIALLDVKLLLFANIIYESFNVSRSLWQWFGSLLI